MVSVRRAYVDGMFGQVHLIDAPAPASDKPLLVCLHATAYSVESLRPLVAAFAGDRPVVALDTPGYGGSDGPGAPVTIADYADALADTIERLSPGRPVDIFGYHTGITIAVEAAVRQPGRIGRIAMIGVPYFDGPDRAEWERRLVVRHALGDTLDQFGERWDYLVAGRPAGLDLAGGFVNFVDELRAWPDGWWAHDALFAHDLGAALDRLDMPVLVINPNSALAGPSRLAAARIRGVELVERPDLSGALFAVHAAEIAGMVGGFLDRVRDDTLGADGKGSGASIA